MFLFRSPGPQGHMTKIKTLHFGLLTMKNTQFLETTHYIGGKQLIILHITQEYQIFMAVLAIVIK
jgi:hypothetical protein